MRRTRFALVSVLGIVVGSAGSAAAKGGAAAPAAKRAPEWSEEDGLAVLRVFAPREGKAWFAPAPDAATKPAELVVVLHGHGGTAPGMLRTFSSLATERGAALLCCEGSTDVPTDRGPGRGWQGADVEAILAALDATLAAHALDAKRVLLVGFSAGASMSVETQAARPAAFAGVCLFASPRMPTSANKGGRFAIVLGTKDGNFVGFPGAVSVCEKTVVGRAVAVTDLEHALPDPVYLAETVAWAADPRRRRDVLHLPLRPDAPALAPPGSPAAKAKGKTFRHALFSVQGAVPAAEPARPRDAAKAAAAACASAWKASLAASKPGTDLGAIPAAATDDPLSKDAGGIVTGAVLARYGGALVSAMSALRGGAVSPVVEGASGFHVVARDPE